MLIIGKSLACVSRRYVRNFTSGEMVVAPEKEARLTVSVIDHITVGDVNAMAEYFRPHCSMVIRIDGPRPKAREKDLASIVADVESMECRGEIQPWRDLELPDRLMEKPQPGSCELVGDWKQLGAKEYRLGNGMRVVLKQTEFLDDQVVLSGFALGGMSQLQQSNDMRAAKVSTFLAGELGPFGFRPERLEDMLAGRRVSVEQGVGLYSRSLSGEASPAHMEMELGLLHKLFTSNPTENLKPGELRVILRFGAQSIRDQARSPNHAFKRAVKSLNTEGRHKGLLRSTSPLEFRYADVDRAVSLFRQIFSPMFSRFPPPSDSSSHFVWRRAGGFSVIHRSGP